MVPITSSRLGMMYRYLLSCGRTGASFLALLLFIQGRKRAMEHMPRNMMKLCSLNDGGDTWVG
jgi:hypothetical protein